MRGVLEAIDLMSTRLQPMTAVVLLFVIEQMQLTDAEFQQRRIQVGQALGDIIEQRNRIEREIRLLAASITSVTALLQERQVPAEAQFDLGWAENNLIGLRADLDQVRQRFEEVIVVPYNELIRAFDRLDHVSRNQRLDPMPDMLDESMNDQPPIDLPPLQAMRPLDPSLEQALREISRHGLGAGPQSPTERQQQPQRKTLASKLLGKYGSDGDLQRALEQHGLDSRIDKEHLDRIVTLQPDHPDIPALVRALDTLSSFRLQARPLKQENTKCVSCHSENSDTDQKEPLPFIVCPDCSHGVCLTCLQTRILPLAKCFVCRRKVPWWQDYFG